MDPKRLSPPPLLSPSARFQLPDYQSHSPSPSRSPNRRHHFTANELDPLLANLSPASTLEALRENDAVPHDLNVRQRGLADSIANASASERALGIRAALAGKKLREWCNEASTWVWPSSQFEPPSTGKGSSIYGKEATTSSERDGFLGSLPEHTVRDIEERIEAIRDEMDALDLEELKDHVRGAHFLPQSRASSAFGLHEEVLSTPRYNHLDDFTVIITATIMQALPYLSRLVDLLDVWAIRILVLKQVPIFLQHLEDAKIAVESAWHATTQVSNTTGGTDLSRDAFRTMRAVLEGRVSELAQRIDGMLDALEGRDDRIPDSWIDGMEAVEEDFKTWVFEAERLVEHNELLARMSPPIPDSEPPEHIDQDIHSSEAPYQLQSQEHAIMSVGDSAPSVVDPAPSSLRRSESSYDGTNETALAAPEPEPNTIPSADSRSAVDTLDEREARRLSGLRPTPLNLTSSLNTSDDVDTSNSSLPPSTTSSEFSNLSSPQIMDAATVQYFKTPVDTTFKSVPWQTEDQPLPQPSNTVSRQSSQRTERSTRTLRGGSVSQVSLHSPSRSRASSTIAENQILDPRIQSVRDEFTDNVESANRTVVRRASSTSIEKLPRSEIRNITIRRSSSYSSNSPTKSPPKLSPEHSGSPIPIADQATTEHKDINVLRSGSSSPLKEEVSHFSTEFSEAAAIEYQVPVESDVVTLPTHSPEFPLPSPTLSEETIDDAANAEPTTPIAVAEASSPDVIRLSPAKHSANMDDKLTQKISNILANLPTAIRLSSNPDIDVRESPRRTASAQVGLVDTPTPPSRPQRAVSTTAAITLAPARAVKARPRGDNDIKVYHLHQPGKDIPIKLYVRLVGEGEQRVMVRVGGGWADLGVYLQEYANHHGRRTVSDGKFEIKGLPTAQAASASSLNPFTSGGSTSGSRPGSPDPRPSSSLANRKVRRSSGVSVGPYTPEMPSRTWDAIPGSAESMASSVRSSSRMSWTDEDNPLGMAGPKSKPVDISPQKKAWVDGMMSQARQVSYEMKKSSPGEFGELGKAGNTRRVFLKSTKPDD